MDQLITGFVQPLLTALISALVPVVLALGARFVQKKTGIAISEESRRKLEDLATKAVLSVEEMALAQAKKGDKWPSGVKQNVALQKVLSLAPHLSQEQADMLVHWAVARIPGIGATGVLGGSNGADTMAGRAGAAAEAG